MTPEADGRECLERRLRTAESQRMFGRILTPVGGLGASAICYGVGNSVLSNELFRAFSGRERITSIAFSGLAIVAGVYLSGLGIQG
jgi:hypothetical protein